VSDHIDINELLKDHRTGQDDVQNGMFVLGGRSEWGTYKQGLREFYKRIRGLRQIICSRDKLLIDIEELEYNMEEAAVKLADMTLEEAKIFEKSKEGFQLRRDAIDLKEKYGAKEESDRVLSNTKREATLYYMVCEKLKKKLGDISEERRRELDIEEWKHFHKKRASISLRTTGRIDDVVLGNLASLPSSIREDWMKDFMDKDLIGSFVDTLNGDNAALDYNEEEIKLLEDSIEQDVIGGLDLNVQLSDNLSKE
jgi:hypothetical protein